jgi:hypothetical protein
VKDREIVSNNIMARHRVSMPILLAQTAAVLVLGLECGEFIFAICWASTQLTTVCTLQQAAQCTVPFAWALVLHQVLTYGPCAITSQTAAAPTNFQPKGRLSSRPQILPTSVPTPPATRVSAAGRPSSIKWGSSSFRCCVNRSLLFGGGPAISGLRRRSWRLPRPQGPLFESRPRPDRRRRRRTGQCSRRRRRRMPPSSRSWTRPARSPQHFRSPRTPRSGLSLEVSSSIQCALSLACTHGHNNALSTPSPSPPDPAMDWHRMWR